MEPLAVQTAASLRPLVQPVADLAQVLQNGRAVDAEVLQTFTGGTVLLGIGGRRVSAQSQVELQAGESLRVLVQGEGEELVLKILQRGATPPEPELVRWLRAVVGEDRPVGERLLELLQALRAQGSLPGGEPGGAAGAPAELASRLAAELEQHALQPGGDGAMLRALLVRSGFAQEASLGELAQLVDGTLPPERASPASSRALVGLLLEDLAGTPTGAELGPSEGLRAALESALAEGLASARGGGGVAGFLRSLQRALAAILRGAPEDPVARVLAGHLNDVDPTRFAGTRLGALVAHAAGLPSALSREELVRALVAARLLDLRGDLKTRLLAAQAGLEDGPLHDALSRALAGLEADQLLELARRSAHDWRAWSFPVPEQDAWRSARLFHRREGGAEREAGGEDASHHLVLGLELGGLGAVRADLWLGAHSLSVRLRVADGDAQRALREELGPLKAELAGLRPELHVVVLGASATEISVDELAFDIRYLADNPLLDLAG